MPSYNHKLPVHLAPTMITYREFEEEIYRVEGVRVIFRLPGDMLVAGPDAGRPILGYVARFGGPVRASGRDSIQRFLLRLNTTHMDILHYDRDGQLVTTPVTMRSRAQRFRGYDPMDRIRLHPLATATC